MMRSLARAIRSFSAMRAREKWDECSVALATLQHDLVEAASNHRPPVLCLRCAAYFQSEPQHDRDPECIAIKIASANEDGTGPDMVREIIEDFRAQCERSGKSHYDLDCYIFNDQMVFAWRPLHDSDAN